MGDFMGDESSARGYIYILLNPAFTNYVKIGRTIKDPHLRAKEISVGTGVPAPFQVVWDTIVNNCDQVERMIHQELSNYRGPSRLMPWRILPVGIYEDVGIDGNHDPLPS